MVGAMNLLELLPSLGDSEAVVRAGEDVQTAKCLGILAARE